MKNTTPSSSTPAPGRKHTKARTAVVGVLAAGLLLGGGVIAANAATPSGTSPTAAATSQPTATAAAAAKTALTRHPLAVGLRFFVNGDSSKPNYGQRAAKIATFILDKRPKLAAKLPAALQADLKALKEAADGDRVAKATHIRDTALNGGYGPKIQAQAKRMQEQKADRKA
ncbi:hypothetical protein [Arthrobacter sp. FW306-2-2C-D06B]|uniref:hypothetical protein n=1 Tax=Arthrobacter sp. FW306-2-2C-D06B TaxID=2879618 RepID=UPI001F189346|nr:hypothetical protein [Arthrobacter sp. FW306-2-2C-D06B]UKA58980.1 hypothetical protein LFT47_01070 [Arthrobacter sp. FW306-2-2C-D06B]